MPLPVGNFWTPKWRTFFTLWPRLVRLGGSQQQQQQPPGDGIATRRLTRNAARFAAQETVADKLATVNVSVDSQELAIVSAAQQANPIVMLDQEQVKPITLIYTIPIFGPKIVWCWGFAT